MRHLKVNVECLHLKFYFQLAKYTEEERRAMHESDGFFDFDNGADHSPLEDPHHQNGRQNDLQSPRHLQQQDMANLAHEVEKMKVNAAHQPRVVDPAILNVMRFPPGQMPPFLPPGVPPMQLPPGILPQSGHFAGPPPSGLNDPAIMSMSQLPPHLLLLQQQQQQQQFQRQSAMMSQPPPQQTVHHGGVRTVEDIERQLMSDARQQDERRHQQQQQLHQQQQQARFHQHQQQMRHQYQQHQQQHQFQNQHQHQHQQQRYNNNQGHNFGNSGNFSLDIGNNTRTNQSYFKTIEIADF